MSVILLSVSQTFFSVSHFTFVSHFILSISHFILSVKKDQDLRFERFWVCESRHVSKALSRRTKKFYRDDQPCFNKKKLLKPKQEENHYKSNKINLIWNKGMKLHKSRHLHLSIETFVNIETSKQTTLPQMPADPPIAWETT